MDTGYGKQETGNGKQGTACGRARYLPLAGISHPNANQAEPQP